MRLTGMWKSGWIVLCRERTRTFLHSTPVQNVPGQLDPAYIKPHNNNTASPLRKQVYRGTYFVRVYFIIISRIRTDFKLSRPAVFRNFIAKTIIRSAVRVRFYYTMLDNQFRNIILKISENLSIVFRTLQAAVLV